MPAWLSGQTHELVGVFGKAALMYGTAVLGLRVAHRRTLSQWTAIDFAAAVAIGAIIGRTAIASGQSYLVGATALLTVLGAHALVRRRPVVAVVRQGRRPPGAGARGPRRAAPRPATAVRPDRERRARQAPRAGRGAVGRSALRPLRDEGRADRRPRDRCLRRCRAHPRRSPGRRRAPAGTPLLSVGHGGGAAAGRVSSGIITSSTTWAA